MFHRSHPSEENVSSTTAAELLGHLCVGWEWKISSLGSCPFLGWECVAW